MKDSTSKISTGFAARIHSGRSKAPIQAVLLLAGSPASVSAKRQTRAAGRAKKIAAQKKTAGDLLPLVDLILSKHHGRRLSPGPDAFGSITIESTAEGILELAKQSWTRAILEDQRVIVGA